jgi:hypothetical protein
MTTNRVRMILWRYIPPDRATGKRGSYQPIPGLARTIEVRDERAEARLWQALDNAAKLFEADELISDVEASGAIGPVNS